MNTLRFFARRRGSTTTARWWATAPLVAGTLLLAACAATPPPAGGPPDDGGQEPDGPAAHFVLRITPETTASPAPAKATLACDPDGGTHPDPRAACEELRNVDGDFERLSPPEPYMCTLEIAPVRVEAIGYWNGERVDYTETFDNPCIAAAETLGIFQF